MTLFIIANPQAGNGGADKIVDKVKNLVTSEEVTVLMTEKRDDEAYQVKRLLALMSDTDKLLVIGGDGTLSKVLFHLPVGIPIAYFPVGSGNDFAHALKLLNLENSIEAMLSNKVEPFYCYHFESGVIINSLDLGFPAYVVYTAEKSQLKYWLNKIHLGKLIYLIIALKSLFKSPLAQVEIVKDGHNLKLDNLYLFSLANNTYFGGGITIWPNASALTPDIELVYASHLNLIQRINLLLHIVLNRHTKTNNLKHEKISDITVNFPQDSLIEIDGEIVTLNTIHLKKELHYIYK